MARVSYSPIYVIVRHTSVCCPIQTEASCVSDMSQASFGEREDCSLHGYARYRIQNGMTVLRLGPALRRAYREFFDAPQGELRSFKQVTRHRLLGDAADACKELYICTCGTLSTCCHVCPTPPYSRTSRPTRNSPSS